MTKALFNLPVLTTAAFSLAATVVIVAIVFFKPEPPTLLLDEPWDAPAFEVVDQDGNTVTREDMLGKVWVCDFFLTRCGLICPTLAKTMAGLVAETTGDAELADVEFVSFSVDPEHDTVEQLKIYRNQYAGIWSNGQETLQAQLDQRWKHTRSDDKEAFWTLVRDDFKLYVGPSENDPTTPVAHSGKLVLIDRKGQIRGYYEGTTKTEIPALIADTRRVVNESD
jgi:protein SCO1/2